MSKIALFITQLILFLLNQINLAFLFQNKSNPKSFIYQLRWKGEISKTETYPIATRVYKEGQNRE